MPFLSTQYSVGVLPSVTEFGSLFYRVLRGFTGFYRVWQFFAVHLLSFTGIYWVLPGFSGFYRVLVGFAGIY